MYPILFRIGDFEITSFGLLVAIWASPRGVSSRETQSTGTPGTGMSAWLEVVQRTGSGRSQIRHGRAMPLIPTRLLLLASAAEGGESRATRSQMSVLRRSGIRPRCVRVGRTASAKSDWRKNAPISEKWSRAQEQLGGTFTRDNRRCGHRSSYERAVWSPVRAASPHGTISS